MQDKEIIISAVDELTGKVVYSFTVLNRNLNKRTLLYRLLRKPKPEPTKTFTISPTVVAVQYKIAARALSLPVDLFDDQTKMLSYVPEHLPTMVQIIGLAITNNKSGPDKELIEYLECNLDNDDVLQVLSASLQSSNMQSFLTSIVLMNGLAKMIAPTASPLDGRELIASHTQE